MGDAWAKVLSEGGILAALVVILFIVKALVPLFTKNGENGSKVRLDLLEREVEGLRKWRHEVLNAAQEIIARDFLDKRK